MRFGFKMIGASLFMMALILGCGSPHSEPSSSTGPTKGVLGGKKGLVLPAIEGEPAPKK
jgi:hypothetical protein